MAFVPNIYFYFTQITLIHCRAVDGSVDTSSQNCAHKNNKSNPQPWWLIDLQKKERVTHVALTNRKGATCMSFCKKMFSFFVHKRISWFPLAKPQRQLTDNQVKSPKMLNSPSGCVDVGYLHHVSVPLLKQKAKLSGIIFFLDRRLRSFKIAFGDTFHPSEASTFDPRTFDPCLHRSGTYLLSIEIL